MKNKGGAFYTQNMRKSPSGSMLSAYALTSSALQISSTTTEWLTESKNWVEKVDNNITTFWSLQADGSLYIQRLGIFFRAIVDSETIGIGGMVLDFENEIIVVGTRYIGRTATTTLDGSVSIGAGTINVVDASNFPTSGEVFISDGINSETFSYSGKSTNQLTGVTKGLYNTTDRAHGSGTTIFGFNEQWKDLGVSGVGGQAIRFQDAILVANEPTLAGWRSADGSDFDASFTSFALPAQYTIKDLSVIDTGAGERVLIAANKDKEAALIIWDGISDDWDRIIYVRENISKLYDNYVATDSGIYQTNGFSLSLVAELPDDEGDPTSSDLSVADLQRKGDILFVANNSNQLDRNRSGLWLLDLKELDWFLVMPSNKASRDITFGAMFISADWTIYITHNYGNGTIDTFFSDPTSRGNVYQVVYDPQTTRILRLKDFKLNLDFKLKTTNTDDDFAFDIIVRYYTYNKAFLQNSEISATSTASEIKLTEANFALPAVGDRIEVIQKTTVAENDVGGAIRNITAVSTAGGVHTCTLDEDLPAAIDSDLVNNTVLLNPLIKTEKKSFSGKTIDLKNLVFLVTGQPEFKKLLIEVEFRNNSSTVIAPGLNYIEIETTSSVR